MHEYIGSQASVSRLFPRRSSAPAFTEVDRILNDPELSKLEKRAILAGWISDARAVADAPSMRRVDGGALISVDEILSGLKALDDDDDPPPALAARIPSRLAA